MKKVPEISPTFCVYPWMEFIIGPNAEIKLCCISGESVKNQSGGAYSLEKMSPDEYWNSYGLRKIRQKMLSGEKLKDCGYCYYQESIGMPSYRQSFNTEWLVKSKYGRDILACVEKSRKNNGRVEKPPLYLDIRHDNLCNLKCRMCNPSQSSKIYQEQKGLLKTHPEISPMIETNHFQKDEKRFHNWHKDEKIWSDVYKWLPQVKKLYFTGGEPSLIQKNWELIKSAETKGYAKNIHLAFNINCTHVPDKLLNTFKAFGSVNITFSVDGFKEVNEYIRYPSKWETVEGNVVKILKHKKPNCQMYFSPAVQVYNILDFPRLLRWIDGLVSKYGDINNAMILCTWPKYFDISILPANIKSQAFTGIENYEKSYKGNDKNLLKCLSSIKHVLKSAETPGMEQNLRQFHKYTTLLDQKRNNSFKNTFPTLNRLLNEDGRWISQH